MRFWESKGNDKPRADVLSKRDYLRVARGHVEEIAQKIQAGAASIEDLRPLALSALARVLENPTAKDRDLRGAANIVRQWLADEKGEQGAGSITAIQVIVNQPAPVQGNGAPGALGDGDGHDRPGSVEADGFRVRLNGHHAGA